MLKTYELTARHFGWDRPPRPATDRQVADYLLDRALRSQGLVSLASVCHLEPSRKPEIRARRSRRGCGARALVPVAVGGPGARSSTWAEPAVLDASPAVAGAPRPHPLAIRSAGDPAQKASRCSSATSTGSRPICLGRSGLFGYFALPVLVGDAVVAVIDLKADREAGALRVQQWSLELGRPRPAGKRSSKRRCTGSDCSSSNRRSNRSWPWSTLRRLAGVEAAVDGLRDRQQLVAVARAGNGEAVAQRRSRAKVGGVAVAREAEGGLRARRRLHVDGEAPARSRRRT